MKDFTFLNQEQCFNNKISIFERIGIKARITDFAIALGCSVYDDFDDKPVLENRIGRYWTTDSKEISCACVFNEFGMRYWYNNNFRNIGARPVLSFSSILNTSKVGLIERNTNDILEIEYGFYPQKAVSKDMQDELNNIFQKRDLQTTGHTFTVDAVKNRDYDSPFSPKMIDVYEYQGKKYVHICINSACDDDKKLTLSNGEKYANGDFVWIEVEPVKWLIDEKDRLLLSEKILFGGIKYRHNPNHGRNEKDIYLNDKICYYDFSKSDIKKYMDNYFERDLLQLGTLEYQTGMTKVSGNRGVKVKVLK